MGPLLNWVLMVSAVELSPVDAPVVQEFGSDPLHLLNGPLSMCHTVQVCCSLAEAS